MDELQQERYAADLTALAECIAKGVSQKAIEQLAFECGIHRRDMEVLWNFKQEAA